MIKFIKSISSKAMDIIDQLVPDKDKANEIKSQFNQKLLDIDEQELKAAASIISAEANGESWLQRNWRPITMLTFTGLIVAHWLGFTPENLTENEVLGLLDIVQIGLGGYVLGRSAEKVAKNWKN